MDDFTLKQFTSLDQATSTANYVSALEAFDGIEQLQELKAIARQRGGLAPGKDILDVGCGFGLETLRLAAVGPPTGSIAGVVKSADFINDARLYDSVPFDALHTGMSCLKSMSVSIVQQRGKKQLATTTVLTAAHGWNRS